MPAAAASLVKSSWADEIELDSGALPPPTEVSDGRTKTLTEYRVNSDGKREKVVRTFRIEKRVVSRDVAARKLWRKFGESAEDKPGPNPATTIAAEDVFMQFVTSKEGEDAKHEEEDALKKLKALGDKNVVKCRNCQGDHWTSKCPWKDTVIASGGKLDDKLGRAGPAHLTGDGLKSGGEAASAGAGPGKYVPPSMRDGAGKRLDSLGLQKRDDTTAIRITNLSTSTTEEDITDLVKQFGAVNKLYLAKDKITGECKGFAYVHFKSRKDAALAISRLNGYGYDHLILSVDWSKPPANSQ